MTDRLPFDPSKMAMGATPATASSAPGDAPITVSQLAGRIGAALAVGFPASIRVIGQVSGFRERTHWYFDLKDAEAVASCVMFASAARKLKFLPESGQEVVVTGRVDYYAKGGKVSLIVERIEPVGAGALELAFRRLCEELRALGWFDAGRKRPLPTWPRRVAIVTSRTGAALQDVLDTMRRRFPLLPVAVLDVRVQGDGAAEEVAAAVDWLGQNRARLAVDVLLITRGGGSMEDLWAFNERVVAEAIVRCPIPVVAAIGHETDTTIAELVADLRCATPTQAAMRITPDREALGEQIEALAERLRRAVLREVDQGESIAALGKHLRLAATGRVRDLAHRLERLAGRLEKHRPAAAHARRAATFDSVSSRLATAMQRRLAGLDLTGVGARLGRAWVIANARIAADLAAKERQLAAIGPMSVLRRGFSYTLMEDGRLLRTPGQAIPGDRLRTRLADGEVRSVVDGVLPVRVSVRPKRPVDPAAPQMDLFNPGR